MRRLVFASIVTLALACPVHAQTSMSQPVSGQTNPWPVTKVIGVTVFNGQNEEIGKIADLLMDPQARVPTAIVAVSGAPLNNQRYVQVPLDTIRFPKDASQSVYPQKAILATSKDTLAGMPEFKY